jgi:hypothetical protein
MLILWEKLKDELNKENKRIAIAAKAGILSNLTVI